ncbi:hypothetical protein HYW94_00145 [Candidatus Uhrbacteria bacterium]|nr:hypothetical protein [Candidatus Uhrbacteria bacterium]
MKNNDKKTFFSSAYFCESCGMSSRNHLRTWIQEFMQLFLGKMSMHMFPRSLEQIANRILEYIFLFFGILHLTSEFTKQNIPIRTYCLIQEGEKRGIIFQAFQSPFGFMNYFRMRIQGKEFSFEGLPVADFANTRDFSEIDDKARAKKRLMKGNFPTLQSRAFWFFQKNDALRYGEQTGYPLVVKPRNGSYSRHTTTNILNKEQLISAINETLAYSPTFIVESFLGNSFVFRATVIDFDYVACVRRTPANVMGDGIHTVQKLIDIKNADPDRGDPDEETYTLFKIPNNTMTEQLLREQGYTKQSVLPYGKKIFLQQDPFIRLGADSDEVTDMVHPDTMTLFKDIARYFDIRVVGLDFLCSDIQKSWKEQSCAVLELNSLPCIEVHHFPSSGTPQNVAGKIIDMIFKYYPV